jgi:hypothetical protein
MKLSNTLGAALTSKSVSGPAAQVCAALLRVGVDVHIHACVWFVFVCGVWLLLPGNVCCDRLQLSLRSLLIMLSPIAPHLAAELWERLVRLLLLRPAFRCYVLMHRVACAGIGGGAGWRRWAGAYNGARTCRWC